MPMNSASLLQIIKKRRSVRVYKAGKVSDKQLEAILEAARMGFGTVWVSVREEIEPELRELFNVPQPIRLLWVVPIGRARFWPGAKPRRTIADFTHYESYEPKKLRDESWIRAWPKGRAQS